MNALVAHNAAFTSVFATACSGDKVKIGVQTGTTGEFYVKGNEDMMFEGYKNIECLPYSNGGLAAKAMVDGLVDYVIIDNGPAAQIVAQNKDVKMIDIALSTEEYAFGVDKNQPELLNSVNAFIDKIKALFRRFSTNTTRLSTTKMATLSVATTLLRAWKAQLRIPQMRRVSWLSPPTRPLLLTSTKKATSS